MKHENESSASILGRRENMLELFPEANRQIRNYPLRARHLIYSYLDRSTVLQKISILSTSERMALVDAQEAAKGKSYRIEIAGQRNAQRQLYGEATRLKYVLRIIENVTICASALPTTFGKKLAMFIADLPD